MSGKGRVGRDTGLTTGCSRRNLTRRAGNSACTIWNRTGTASDFLLPPAGGGVTEAKELVDPLPEDSRGRGIGPPGPGRKQSAADPKNR